MLKIFINKHHNNVYLNAVCRLQNISWEFSRSWSKKLDDETIVINNVTNKNK